MPQAIPTSSGRRPRRTRATVTARICDAARQLFAERGYQGATTREIAQLADVSETLLFRYYGSKAILFDEVVARPFNDLLQDFLRQYPTSQSRKASEGQNFSAVYDLFEENNALFIALLSNKATASDEVGRPSFQGLTSFFEMATVEQVQKYAELGQAPPFDIALAIRLAFGMLASTVLFRDLLFPDGAPPRETLVLLLERFVSRALDPAPPPGPVD